jgi:hypothetical protein
MAVHSFTAHLGQLQRRVRLEEWLKNKKTKKNWLGAPGSPSTHSRTRSPSAIVVVVTAAAIVVAAAVVASRHCCSVIVVSLRLQPSSSSSLLCRHFVLVGACENQKGSQNQKKENEKQIKIGRTWQPVRPFPTPFVAVRRRGAGWDGVSACENEKVSQKKKRKRKKFQDAPGSPYDRSPARSLPFVAVGPFATVWDGVSACENQKVSKKKIKKTKKKKFGRTWQPVCPFPTPFVALHCCLSVHGRLGRCQRLWESKK